LKISNGGQMGSNTFGRGNGGTVTIKAGDVLNLRKRKMPDKK
jgi:hypothetical protein